MLTVYVDVPADSLVKRHTYVALPTRAHFGGEKSCRNALPMSCFKQ
jgi:hypothetical protein